MFLGMVINQGEKIHQLVNENKQVKEENEMLRDEIDFKSLKQNRYERLLNDVIYYMNSIADIDYWNNEDTFKRQSRNALMYELKTKIIKELDNATNID